MANGAFWQILWVVVAIATGGVMFGAWTGPHRSVSNLSRWAVRLRIPAVPAWFKKRATDRWAFRGGLVTLVLLLAVAWLVPSSQAPDTPAAVPDKKEVVAPPAPSQTSPAVIQRPGRHIDTEMKNAILVHVPKAKQVRIVLLAGDPEADQFAWEIDAFLRMEGYTVIPRLFFAMAAGGQTPSGTSMYPDEKDQNIVVIRIGLNDRV